MTSNLWFSNHIWPYKYENYVNPENFVCGLTWDFMWDPFLLFLALIDLSFRLNQKKASKSVFTGLMTNNSRTPTKHPHKVGNCVTLFSVCHEIDTPKQSKIVSPFDTQFINPSKCKNPSKLPFFICICTSHETWNTRKKVAIVEKFWRQIIPWSISLSSEQSRRWASFVKKWCFHVPTFFMLMI